MTLAVSFDYFARAAGQQLRVLQAVLRRDTRTRFGGGGRSFTLVLAIGVPLGHLFGLMMVPFALPHVTPLGTDYAVFAATGALPFILSLYPSRMIMLSLVENRPLLAFPVVKPPDLVWARAAMDIVIAFSVTLLFLAILSLAGFDMMPFDVAEATAAFAATIGFGVSLGFVSAVIMAIFRPWLFVHIVLMIGLHLASGALFLVRDLPESVRDVIWFNPLFHCVEWVRFAYFGGYGDEFLSRSYLLGFTLLLLLLGMLLERFVRGLIVSKV